MNQPNYQFSVKDDSDLLRALNLFFRNYKLLAVSVVLALIIAYFLNRTAIPVYRVSASLLIKETNNGRLGGGGDAGQYINQDLFGINQGFQNELYVLQSSPVLEQTVKNLDLTISYYFKDRFKYIDAYNSVPFRILLLQDHVQPVNLRFHIAFDNRNGFTLKAEGDNVVFSNLYTGENTYSKNNWQFEKSAKFGDLIETGDLAFIIERDSLIPSYVQNDFVYSFVFAGVPAMAQHLKGQFSFVVTDRDATVVDIYLRTPSPSKGIDIVNELMDVYSTQNVNRKNHIAAVTIDYIERQLSEISDSLSQTEDNLQYFRSSRQLLDLNNQATNMSEQFMDLQNQLAELVTRKRYYDYLADYLISNQELSEVIVPTSMGVQDELLNGLVSELIAAQNQRTSLIRNRQERNPLVQRLEIQIENTKKTIYENITALQKTTEIAIDEMNKRINRVKADITRLPKTQRQLGGIERKYRLNDAIYNYLLEKRAEAKISQASNLPDNLIIEPASFVGMVAPNGRKNYVIAFALGLMIPYVLLFLGNLMKEKIDYHDNIDHLTDAPLLGKIPHNKRKSSNVIFEFPKSGITEAYRALRTNIEYRYKNKPHKVILVTSCTEGEGKSFSALNLAMIYALLGKYTILVDFDLRKPTRLFYEKEISPVGLSTYIEQKSTLGEIIHPSPSNKLDYIPSGPIPSNPVEMLASDDIRDLIDQLKERYDCIVIDTSPLAQVADAYMLLDYADIKIVVARYNHSVKKVFHLVMNDLKQRNVNDLYVVLNDNRVTRGQYGYGYGYETKKRKWFIF
ncbi:MAG: polysaccharide biosynthesis tyrosine autokinase [Bacteroidales bacterium]|nr:polysaccharide biosynthesis tyrosine autokinase [Bacteroidales bacterium]